MKAADLFRRNQHHEPLPVFDSVSEIRSDSSLKLSSRRALLFDVLIELVISFLSGYSFVHVFTSAFDLTVREYYFLPAVLLLSVFVLLIARDKKIGVILFIGAISAAVVFSIVRLEELVAECTGIYDRLVQAFDEAYRTETDIHYAIAPHSDVTFIMIIFSILPVWQTGYSYGRNIPPFIATVFLLIPPVLAAVCLKAPGLLPVSVLLFCILLQFFLCRSECLSESHEMARSTQLKLRFVISAFTAALIAVLVVFSAYLIYPLVKKPFRAAAKAYASSSISDLLAKIEGNPFDISKPGMSEGDFSNVGEVVRNNKAIMSVSFEANSPHETYLRGFAGDRYTGKAWEKQRDSVPASQMPDEIHFSDVYFGRVDKADVFFRNPFLYYQALYASALAHDADAVNVITIREEDDRDRYVYLPYGIRGASSDQLKGASFTGDLYAVSDRTQRTVFTTAGIGTLHDALVKASARQYLEGVRQPDGTPLSGYETADYMRELLSERYGISISAEELKENPYTEYVFTDSQHREIHIRQKEACLSEYEDWVLSSNLESGATKRVQDLAAEIAMDFSIDRGACEYEKAIAAVQQYLWTNKEYSLSPGAPAEETDFVEDFLFSKEGGYCVHFASAGTVLLRELGIPCRYAEGYLVPAAAARTEVSVTDEHAHAWTEVFIPGYGWYPVEMTLSEENDTAMESSFTLESSESSPQDENETSEDANASSEAASSESAVPETEGNPGGAEQPSVNPEKESSGNGGSGPAGPLFELPKWLLPVILAILLLAGAVIFFLYKKYHIVPMEKLKEENNKKTCLKIYEKIRRQAGAAGRKFTPDSSGKEMEALFPLAEKARLGEMQRIIKETCYSKHDEPDENVKFLYRIYEERLLMPKKKASLRNRKPSRRSGKQGRK